MNVALGDNWPEQSGSSSILAVWTVERASSLGLMHDPLEQLLETLARTLDHEQLAYTLLNAETAASTEATWWSVVSTKTGQPTGARVRGTHEENAQRQLQSLANFLGVDPATLAVVPDDGQG